MFQISNFTDNDDVKILASSGPFTVIEYQRDLSVTPGDAQTAYFCSAMNVRKRQVICDLSKANITPVSYTHLDVYKRQQYVCHYNTCRDLRRSFHCKDCSPEPRSTGQPPYLYRVRFQCRSLRCTECTVDRSHIFVVIFR